MKIWKKTLKNLKKNPWAWKKSMRFEEKKSYRFPSENRVENAFDLATSVSLRFTVSDKRALREICI